ncbi:hypothetical protein DEO72_LG6g1190 [Vigna unguiculata]|uniref:Uncharacterized protein n=1 Tax=Vigna unguiculata TaxID=3917 RepID=A0A4D6M8N6_VIGUN|nr:hypothetical protein DEO72_LG6g1190 [Vigna unguiculata]
MRDVVEMGFTLTLFSLPRDGAVVHGGPTVRRGGCRCNCGAGSRCCCRCGGEKMEVWWFCSGGVLAVAFCTRRWRRRGAAEQVVNCAIWWRHGEDDREWHRWMELLRVNGRTWWPRRFWCSEGVDGVVQGRWWRSLGLGFWEMKMMTWQNLIGKFGEGRIMTRGLFWLANFKRWGLPHGMIWFSGV